MVSSFQLTRTVKLRLTHQKVTEPTEAEKTLKPVFLRYLCYLLFKVCLLSLLGVLVVKNCLSFFQIGTRRLPPNFDLDGLRHR